MHSILHMTSTAPYVTLLFDNSAHVPSTQIPRSYCCLVHQRGRSSERHLLSSHAYKLNTLHHPPIGPFQRWHTHTRTLAENVRKLNNESFSAIRPDFTIFYELQSRSVRKQTNMNHSEVLFFTEVSRESLILFWEKQFSFSWFREKKAWHKIYDSFRKSPAFQLFSVVSATMKRALAVSVFSA